MAQSVGLIPLLGMAPPSRWSDLLFYPEAPTVPAKSLPPNPFLGDGRALVAMVHGDDPHAMLETGMSLLGGWERLGASGTRVLVKPNVVNNRPPPTITSPAVLHAVLQSIAEQRPGELIVADSSGIIRFPTRENLEETGIQRTAESVGARVLALEEEPWVRVAPAQARILQSYYVSKPVYEADLVINLPVIKTHRFAHYSCALKNLVGIVHPKDRPSVAFLAGQWHERIAELNLAVHPRLHIADGMTMMIAGGPTSGTPARTNLLLVSGDRIALDVVALSLIRFHRAWPKVLEYEVWEQRQIRHAIALGLGIRGPEEMELVTASLRRSAPAFTEMVEFVRRDIGQQGPPESRAK